jgi:uncharacterized protein YqeY
MIKQRKDSAEQFTAQGRNDLAEVEEAQMKVIEKFLPNSFLQKNWKQKLKILFQKPELNLLKI